MGEVDLQTNFVDDAGLITDLAKFSSGDMTEKQVRKRHRLSEDAWQRMAEDENLVEKIELEKERRIRSGETKRERAQAYATEVPKVANSILQDDRATKASPRRREIVERPGDTAATS
jgi:hypothetical protein